MASSRRELTSGPDPAASLLALRAQLNASIHSLWTVYAAVGGAAAAFGSATDVKWQGAVAVTAMFWLFTGGHLALLRQTLRASEAVRRDIKQAQREGLLAASLLQRAILEGSANRNPEDKNIVIHLVLDVCISAAIWAGVVANLK